MTREESISMLYGMRADNLSLNDAYTKDKYEALDMAIKALEQEPCEDCISRKDVNEALRKCWLNGTVAYRIVDELKQKIDDLPSIQPQPQTGWIPVSERLPEIADVYRVTRYYPNNIMNPKYIVDACCFDGSNTWYNDNRINHERAYADNVIAWQENPEPYKARK